VTPEFEKLLHRMMAKKEKDRLPSMMDFENELRRIKIFTDEGAEQASSPKGAARP